MRYEGPRMQQGTHVMERENDQLSSKKTRRIIDLETKVKVIRYYEDGKSVSVIARQLHMPQSTIATILRNRDKLTEAAKGSASLKATRLTRMREGPISDMENLLMLWIEEEARKGNSLTTSAIKMKAKNLFDELKEKAGSECDVEFSASSGWFVRFKNRYSVDSVMDSISADAKVTGEWVESLDKFIAGEGYVPEQIFNVDETHIFWNRIFQGGNKKLRSEVTKDVVTVLLGGNAAGYKLKPFVVWHMEVSLKDCSFPVHLRSRTKLTEEVFQDAFNCYVDEIKRYCEYHDIPFKVLLIIDDSLKHSVSGSDIVKTFVVPPNIKTLVQPVDQGVSAAFKAFYVKWTFSELVAAIEGAGKSLQEFWKGYNVLRCVKNISQSWQDVPQQCMTGVWKKVLIRFPIEPWKDDEVIEINKAVIETAESLNLNIEDEVEEVSEVVPEELTNVELLELEQQAPVKRFTERGLAEFFKELDKLLKRAEDMDPDSERFLAIKKKAKAVFSDYWKIYEEKKAQRSKTKASSSAGG